MWIKLQDIDTLWFRSNKQEAKKRLPRSKEMTISLYIIHVILKSISCQEQIKTWHIKQIPSMKSTSWIRECSNNKADHRLSQFSRETHHIKSTAKKYQFPVAYFGADNQRNVREWKPLQWALLSGRLIRKALCGGYLM